MLLHSVDPRGFVTLTLNRPELHNALDDTLITALTEALQSCDNDPSIRAVILRGAGKSFSAGADLNWMRRMADYSEAENLADARNLAGMLQVFDRLSKPTIAVIHGNCFGGGMGLVSCADIAIATESAIFCLPEVRLGLTPATISPYVIRAMGARSARRYFLTAERFDAAEALRMGFVHHVATEEDLDAHLEKALLALSNGGPQAQTRAKELVAAVVGSPIDDHLIDVTVRGIAAVRASDEAREGLSAFIEKRKPGWRN